MGEDGDRAELTIFDLIVAEPRWLDSETSSVTVARFLSEHKKVRDIDIMINSSGGDVYEAAAIYNILRRHGATIHVHIVGLAASAASHIAMAGDHIAMAANAMMMIHQPWTLAIGEAEEMRKSADLLDKITGTLVSTYSARCGQDEDTVRDWIMAETWFTADEAVSAGLADAVTSAKTIAASFDLSRFRHVPAGFVSNLKPTLSAKEQSAMSKPATLTELREACLGSDETFLVDQLEKSASVEDAKSAWISTQAAAIENRDGELSQLKAAHAEALNAANEKIASLEQDIQNIRLGAGDNETPGSGDPEAAKGGVGIASAVRIAGDPKNN